MAEFIGARISLISKRDIRYVGTLHEINSEDSTVALEQVVSHGTENRRPEDFIPPSLDNVYEYIVFRGSDVKDLKIVDEHEQNEPPKPPKMPDDPAILGSTRQTHASEGGSKGMPGVRAPVGQIPAPQPQADQEPRPQPDNAQQHRFPPLHHQAPGHFPQPPPPYGLPPNPRFGPQGFPPGMPGQGFPGMPYGAPPGWFAPYGHPNIPPRQYPPPPMPAGSHGQAQRPQPVPPLTAPEAPSHGPSEALPSDGLRPEMAHDDDLKPSAKVKLPSMSSTSGPPPAEQAPMSANLVGGVAKSAANIPAIGAGSDQPSLLATRSGRVVPAVPLASPALKSATMNGAQPAIPANGATANMAKVQPITNGAGASKALEDANRDARAAVAAAMAKLQPPNKQRNESVINDLTNKINELNTGNGSQSLQATAAAGYPGVPRGGRGGARRARDNSRRNELPASDYDFESANAKFNKEDLVKEAIATGSPIASPGDSIGFEDGPDQGPGSRKASASLASNLGGYDKGSSFFDDISSESKDRAEWEGAGQKLGGREFRNEERQKNFETFGQGSVDNSYRRGGGRGRSRGRGGGFIRGRRGGRGGPRGTYRGARAGLDGA